MLDTVPGGQNGDGGKERGENDKKEADPVQAEVIVDGRNVDPLSEFLKLVTSDANLHLRNEQQREEKFHSGDGKGQAANPNVIVGAQQKQRKAGHSGEEDHDGEQVAAVKHQRTAPTVVARKYGQKTIAMMTSAPITTQTA